MPDRPLMSSCPTCGSELEAGHLSYGSGAVWHATRPRGLGRIFLSAYATGIPVYGSMWSSPFVVSVTALRCPRCATVVVPGR